jgi:hypothetical protein
VAVLWKFRKTVFIGRCKFLASHDGRLQIVGVRGSPLLRFVLLTLALAATGLGLMRVTAARDSTQPTGPEVVEKRPAAKETAIPFRLVLSAPAAEIEIDTGKSIRPRVDGSPISGAVEIDPTNPHVGLIVRWKFPTAAGERRFAKFTLEAPGQETFTHVFDAAGDIDDFIELTLPATK